MLTAVTARWSVCVLDVVLCWWATHSHQDDHHASAALPRVMLHASSQSCLDRSANNTLPAFQQTSRADFAECDYLHLLENTTPSLIEHYTSAAVLISQASAVELHCCNRNANRLIIEFKSLKSSKTSCLKTETKPRLWFLSLRERLCPQGQHL